MYQSILCVREMNVDGCGGFAQVFLLLDKPLTPAEKEKFRTELDRAKSEAEEHCFDTETIVYSAYEKAFGKEPHLLYIDEMEF